jgi:acyl-CoA synthetase (NDP forming)
MLLIIGSVRPGFRESIAKLKQEVDKPLVVALNSLPEQTPEEYNFLAQQGIPVYADAARAARTLSTLARYYSRTQS